MSDKYFVLKNDIDLSGKEWTPIGVSDKYISNKYQGNAFNGNFNGQDNSIRGINISFGQLSFGTFRSYGRKCGNKKSLCIRKYRKHE